MAQITLRGNPINTVGELPAVGSPAPSFTLTGTDLGEVSAEQFRDKPVLLNIFPSVDTPVCAASVRTFNERAAASGVSVLCVSKDLPFAQKRFCGAEDIENVTTASAFRDSFGEDFGICTAKNLQRFRRDLRNGLGIAVMLAPPCTTWSTIRQLRKPLRSYAFPRGLPKAGLDAKQTWT